MLAVEVEAEQMDDFGDDLAYIADTLKIHEKRCIAKGIIPYGKHEKWESPGDYISMIKSFDSMTI